MNTHQTAVTQFIEANGIKFAFRKFGKQEGIPLVFLQHFKGTMDNWDPAITDGFALNRTVIIFNNKGVASTNGETPDNVEAMSTDVISFIDALGLSKIDLFGFSIGGMVAQQVAIDRPELINRLVLVGTGPKGGEGMATFTDQVWEMFGRERAVADELWLDIFFTPSESSQKAGHHFLDRIRTRVENRDKEITAQVAPAQIAAVQKWGAPGTNTYDYLTNIKQPVLVMNGSNDLVIPTINSYILQQHLPDAHLILYPDSNHGSQYHYPKLFVAQVSLFLDNIV